MAESRVRLTFEKGILESQEDSVIQPGWCASCQNWIPEPSGALRVRVGWLNGSTTSAPATRNVKGGTRFAVSRPYATPERLRTATANASATSVTPDFGSASSAGSCLIAVVGGKSNGADVTTFSVPAGWFKIAEQIDNSVADGFGVMLAYRPNTTAQSATFTMTHTGAAPEMVARMMEYSNLDTTDPLDESATNNGTTVTSTVSGKKVDSGTTQPLSQTAGLFVAGFAVATASTWASLTEAFASVNEDAFPTNAEIATYQRVAATGTTAHMEATLATATAWVSVIAAFKAKTQAIVSTDKYVVANRSASDEFKLYSHDRADLSTGAWSLIETIGSLSDTTYPVSFASGLGQLLYTHPSFTTSRRWDASAAASISGSPVGRCVAYRQGRFYIASGSKLYYSKLNDPLVWDLQDYEEFGEDDGFDIEDVKPMSDGLLIAKQNSLWFLSGSGPDDFQKDGPIEGNGFRGRCISITPFGAVVAGEKRVFLFNGRTDEVSKPIETSYVLTGSWISTAYSDDVVQILDSGSQTIFAFNIRTAAWHTETCSSANEGPQFIFSDNERVLFGPKSATSTSLLAYRSFPGTRAQDSVGAATYRATTPEMWRHGPDLAITPMAMYLQLRWRTVTDDLDLIPTVGGVDGDTLTIAAPSSPGTQRVKVSIAHEDYKGIDAVQYRFETTGLVDIEHVLWAYQDEARD